MRLWEFDRLGGIASSSFDINKEGLQFVSVVLGYLCMDNKQLGFDPTIKELHGKCYLHITRNGKTEQPAIVGPPKRTPQQLAERRPTGRSIAKETSPSGSLLSKTRGSTPNGKKKKKENCYVVQQNGGCQRGEILPVCVDGQPDDINGNVQKARYHESEECLSKRIIAA